MSVPKKALLVLLVLLLTACSAPGLAGAPIAQAPNQFDNPTPTAQLYQVPGDATPTATPFQPLPPTPIYIPTDIPTPTPAPEVQPVEPQLGGAVGIIERPKGQVNLLLLGSDARSRQKLFRPDTIILASLNPDKGTVDMVPRRLVAPDLPARLEAGRSISRLWPKPGRFSVVKPTAESPLRTGPETHHVAKVAPGFAMRARRLNIAGDQRSGFVLGAKPSR